MHDDVIEIREYYVQAPGRVANALRDASRGETAEPMLCDQRLRGADAKGPQFLFAVVISSAQTCFAPLRLYLRLRRPFKVAVYNYHMPFAAAARPRADIHSRPDILPRDLQLNGARRCAYARVGFYHSSHVCAGARLRLSQ